MPWMLALLSLTWSSGTLIQIQIDHNIHLWGLALWLNDIVDVASTLQTGSCSSTSNCYHPLIFENFFHFLIQGFSSIVALHIHACNRLKLAQGFFKKKKKKKEHLVCSEFSINTRGMDKRHAAPHVLYQITQLENHCLTDILQRSESSKPLMIFCAVTMNPAFCYI